MAASSLSLCLPPLHSHHHLHRHRLQAAPLSSSKLTFRGRLELLPPLSLHLRQLHNETRIRCSASSSSSSSASEDDDASVLEPAKSSNSSRVWVAIGVAVVAVAAGIILRRNFKHRGASQLIADLSTSASPSSSHQEAAQFSVNWFGHRISLSERSPGYMYFLLLMAAGFGLFVSEEALNVWVGGTLGRLLTWDQSRDVFISSISANLPYIASTVLWVYWGVCISDMVPFYAGRQAAKSGTGNLIREKLGMSQEKFDQVRANVQRYGNFIGIVERFSLGIRNPTSFIAGFVGIKPMNYFAGVCVGGLVTLPLQMGIGLTLRDRPVAALAGVAAVVVVVGLSVVPTAIVHPTNYGGAQGLHCLGTFGAVGMTLEAKGVWTLLPYIAAGIGSIVFFARQRGKKQSS